MSSELTIFGISAKEINEKYPSLGGYEIICHLILEGNLLPFKLVKSLGEGRHKVDRLNYQMFGVDRKSVLGNPIGEQRIKAWDKYPYDPGEIIETDSILFETEAIDKLIDLYPDIIDFEGVLFSIDPETRDIIHAQEGGSAMSPSPVAKGGGNLTALFLEKKELRDALKEAHARIATLEQKVTNLKDGRGPNKQTQAAREKLANNTAQSWAKRLELSVVLAANMVIRWDGQKGNEPWAKDGFTNKEIKQMADDLGGLSYRGLEAFKKGFIKAYPDVIIKKGSGSRSS